MGGDATTAPQTLSLSKDQKVDLTKTNPGLKKVAVGMGWDLQDGKVFDLDAFVLLLKDGKMLGANDDAGKKASICFFNNKTLPGVQHSGDNLTGAGDGDDETITIDFAALPADCNEVVLAVNIYNQPTANFGQVKNAFCRVYNAEDAAKTSIIRYDMSEDHGSANALVFGRLYKHNEEWKFEAQGKPLSGSVFEVADTYR
jgi:tellurium resistance protein TerD